MWATFLPIAVRRFVVTLIVCSGCGGFVFGSVPWGPRAEPSTRPAIEQKLVPIFPFKRPLLPSKETKTSASEHQGESPKRGATATNRD